jgi:NADH:ubiquinone oxidoreductase subunit H
VALPILAGALARAHHLRLSRVSVYVTTPDRLARLSFDAPALARHLLSWAVPLAISVIGPFAVATTSSLAGVVGAQGDLWFVAPLPLAFASYVAAAGIGLGCAPTVSAVPRRARQVIRIALALALGCPGALLYLGGPLPETGSELAILLIKAVIVAALIHRVGVIGDNIEPAQAWRSAWTIATPIAAANVAVMLVFVQLES